ncbi:MAG: recombination protein RecR [Saprospiraceae bacterium]|nr:recombination protein RecR [Saprospiraceae bacterium]
MNFTSKVLEEAVESLASLPSIGKKSALRLALHLINDNNEKSIRISKALDKLSSEITYCKQCHSVSDDEICKICASHSRNPKVVCVVESIRDVMAIEDTGQFNGVYHVLGGIISPIEGIGPEDINIETLINRIKSGAVNELIMAISPTIEGDTTIYYINKKIEKEDVVISTIARGVSFGGELEYADELTLGRSIATRIPFNNR